jgi:hypothetical protein
MPQRLALDRPTRVPYYAGALTVLAVVAGCGVRTTPLAPASLPPVSRTVLGAWLAPHQPVAPLRYDLRWTYQTQQGSARGRAAVVFVPPDSVRFDYRAPFGRSGAAVVVGDEILWSRPPDDVEQLIGVAPLFWAALGILPSPPPEMQVFGDETGTARRWRYVSITDTLTFVSTLGDPASLAAEMRRLGNVVGTVQVEYADSVRRPVSAHMVFPGSASFVHFTVEAIETVAEVDPSIWKEP